MTSDLKISAKPAHWQDALTRLGQVDRASWAVQRQLIARSVPSLRLPRGTVIGFDDQPISELAFVGFQGPGSTLAGTSLTAHASSVAEVLASKNLPGPSGRVCTTSQIQRATSYARSVGYPVVVRPANSDRPRKPRVVVRSAEEMPAALERIQTEASDRTVYRETTVRTAWIQKVPVGRLLRVLIAGSQVVAAVGGHPETLGFEARRVEDIHPDIRATATAALCAFPGVEHGEVDLVVEDVAEGTRTQQINILAVGGSPVLGTYQNNGDFGLGAAAAVVDHYLLKSGSGYSEALEVRRVKTIYTGVVNPVQFARRLELLAGDFTGASGNINIQTPDATTVSTIYEGDPSTAALLSVTGVRGLVGGQRASTALTKIE